MPKEQHSPDHTVAVTAPPGTSPGQAPVPPASSSTIWDHPLTRTFSSLAIRDFRYLWLGMLTMMGGVQMEMLAIGYLVYDITGDARLLGLVETGFAIPTLALALFGGALADRIDRRRVIQLCQVIQLCASGLIAAAILTDIVTWQHLFFIALIEGSLFAFMMPARQAMIPQLVSREQFTNAMAINSAAFSSMTLVAPAVAGFLYAWMGPGGVYVVITSLHVLAVTFTTLVRPVPPKPSDSRTSAGIMIVDIVDGLRYLLRSRLILTLLAIGLMATLLSWPFRALLPVFVVDIYNREADAMGLLISIMGLGSLIGALVIAQLGRWKRGLLLILGSLVTSIGLAMVAAIPVYYAAAGIMIIMGLGEAARWTISMTLIMENVDDRYRGRISSVFMMNFGLMPLAVLPAGYAIEYFGGQATIGFLAGVLALITAFVFITQKQVRRLE